MRSGWLAGCLLLVACGSSQALDGSGADAGAGGMTGEAGAPSACSASVPSPEMIASTPREDTNLELLALRLSTGVVAEQSIYERVVRDVTAIREADPAIADISYFPEHDGRALFLGLETPTALIMKSGQYHDWDCLNDAYVVEDIRIDETSFAPSALLTLKGIYQLKDLVGDYSELPGVTGVSPNLGGGDGPTLCVTREGDVWQWVFDRASGNCADGCLEHEYTHFSTTADGEVTSLGALRPELEPVYASRDACR